MQVSFVVSLSVHAAILVAAIVGLPAPEEYDVASAEAIPVEILTVSELTKLQAQKKDAKPTETPAPKVEPEPEKVTPKPAPKQEQVAALPPEPAPPEPAPPEPKPEAVAPAPPVVRPKEAEPEKKPEPAPAPKEPEPKPEEKVVSKPVPKPRVKPPAPKKPEFDTKDIAALLNKLPDENRRRIDPSASPDSSPAPGDLASLIGSDSEVTLDEKDALRQQIERCWVPPAGVEGAADLQIRLRVALKQDGSLQMPPELMNSGGSPYFHIASEAAMRAVRRCEPYSMPPEKYGSWKEIILNFDPSQMFRG